jgi:hypothetical protein
MTAIVAATLGGCGGGFTLPDPRDLFVDYGSTAPVLTPRDTGFTVSKDGGGVEVKRPVPAAELVGADGTCQSAPAEAANPVRGVTLTMTECALVALAGRPDRVDLGAGNAGARRAVLVYTRGEHAGTYTFEAGRLKIVEPTPGPQRPAPTGRRRA